MVLRARFRAWLSRSLKHPRAITPHELTENDSSIALHEMQARCNDPDSAQAQQPHEFQSGSAQDYAAMGYAALNQGDCQDAVRWFERGAECLPACAQLYYGMGVARRRLGCAQEALACFERAIQLKPDYGDALIEQGQLLSELGKLEDAEDSFNLALAFESNLLRACLAYGRFLRVNGRNQSALVYFKRAVEQAPESWELWFELALALNNAGETTGAVRAYQKAIEIEPEQASSYVNLGLVYLAQTGDPVRAEECFRRALALAPQLAEAQVNLGLALHEQGRSAEALRYYDELIQARPECVECRWHRALVALALECYEQGWKDYEARKFRGERWWRRAFPFREWDGSPIGDKTILIYAEQGLGDEIMFASCLPDLLSTGATCVVECDVRLVELFRRSFPQAAVHGAKRDADHAWLAHYPEVTTQCAIGSLPRFFRRTQDSFAGRSPYLRPDPSKVQRWQKTLCTSHLELNIGIAWRGGTLKTRKELRSTHLADWIPVLQQEGCRFFSLQAGGAEELSEVSRNHDVKLHDLGSMAEDMEELAAIIATLDLVITVQGSVVHLAGALGRPVWVLLSHSCEWRYLQAGERMPWYSSARLFRQPAQAAWQPILRQVAGSLRVFR